MFRMGRICFFAAILMGTAAPTSATAQTPRIVVMGFGGSGGSTARVQVVRALRDRADFATKSDADAIVSDRGLKMSAVEGRRALTEALDVDYLFWGRVRGKGKSARTEIRVAGRSGKQLTGYEAGAPGTSKGHELIQQAARTALAEAISLSPPRAQKRKEPVAAAAVTTSAAAGTAAAATTKTEAKSRKKGGKNDSQKQKKEQSSKSKKKDDVKELPVFEILVGGGPRFRDIDLKVRAMDGSTESRSFSSGAYADVGGYVLIRPMGRSDNPALQGIVIQGDGGVGFGLKAEEQGITNNIKTWRVLGQVGYLYPIKRLQVGGLVGAGVDTFDIDLNGILPSIQYVYFRVGAAVGYMIIEDFLGFRVDGGYRKPFSLGDIEAAFGSNSTANGFDAVALIGGRLDVGFTYGFRFIWEYYKLDLKGATELSQPSFSSGPGSGTDQAMTFQFLVGWSL